MKPGDLVLVPFPQADAQAGKLRPALVLAIAPGRHKDILLAMITSRDYQVVPGYDEILDPADADFANTGLKARSVVRITRLASVEESLVKAKLGTLAATRFVALRERIVKWLQTP